jgi:hypothetical protein
LGIQDVDQGALVPRHPHGEPVASFFTQAAAEVGQLAQSCGDKDGHEFCQ